MGTEIKMPQLGETVVEGTITKWLKKEGDEVSEDELLVEISTDKVDSEVPSSASGTLQKILVQEGETVKVGTPLALIGEGEAESSGDDGGDEESAESESEEKPKEEEQPQAEDEGAAPKEQPTEDQEEGAESKPAAEEKKEEQPKQ